MIRYIPLLITIFICGCVGYRISHVHGTIEGSNISTPYGPASANLQYEATTCLGNCPKACINEVIVNAN